MTALAPVCLAIGGLGCSQDEAPTIAPVPLGDAPFESPHDGDDRPEGDAPVPRAPVDTGPYSVASEEEDDDELEVCVDAWFECWEEEDRPRPECDAAYGVCVDEDAVALCVLEYLDCEEAGHSEAECDARTEPCFIAAGDEEGFEEESFIDRCADDWYFCWEDEGRPREICDEEFRDCVDSDPEGLCELDLLICYEEQGDEDACEAQADPCFEAADAQEEE